MISGDIDPSVGIARRFFCIAYNQDWLGDENDEVEMIKEALAKLSRNEAEQLADLLEAKSAQYNDSQLSNFVCGVLGCEQKPTVAYDAWHRDMHSMVKLIIDVIRQS